MDEEAAGILAVGLCVAVFGVFYGGDPDLMDALLYWLTDGEITLPVDATPPNGEVE